MAISPEILEWLKNQEVFTRSGEIAITAAYLVSGPRDRQHGAKQKNFQNIVDLWNTYISNRPKPLAPLSAVDCGLMMVLCKIARTQTGEHNPDDYIDMGGYAACAGQIIEDMLSEQSTWDIKDNVVHNDEQRTWPARTVESPFPPGGRR